MVGRHPLRVMGAGDEHITVEEAVESRSILEYQGSSAMFLVGTPHPRVIRTTGDGE